MFLPKLAPGDHFLIIGLEGCQDGFYFLLIKRAAEQVSLAKVAAHFSQQVELRGIFNPFGDSLEPKLVRQFDEAARYFAVPFVFGDGLNKRPIDLQGIQRETDQIEQS